MNTNTNKRYNQRLCITVAPFAYASISPWWSGDWQIGQGLSALVEDELIKQGSFDVYSRQVAGVPSGTILRGTITHFEFDKDGIGLSDRERGRDRNRGRRRSSGLIFGIGFTETRARVGMSCQLIDVEGDTLTVTIGDDQGVRVGDVLSVVGVLKVIRDPDTGNVLEQRYASVGTLHITSLSAHTAMGRFDGKLQPKVGDRVHLDARREQPA